MPSRAAIRRRAELASAFIDRLPIDWTAVLERVSDRDERSAVDALRRLDGIRGHSRSAAASVQPRAWATVVAIAVALGALQAALGLVHAAIAAIDGLARVDLLPHALLAVVFTVASLMLGTAIPRDRRVFFLLGSFTLTASAFARALVNGTPATSLASSVVFRGVYPEAFAQAALWQFATVFPTVRRFTRFDVVARRAASLAAALGAALFIANLLLARNLLPEPLGVLARDHPRNLFWQLFAAASLPALAVLVIRACRAPWHERVKVVRFAWAFGAGGGPLLAVGVARTIPGLRSWMLAVGIRPAADVVVMAALAAMPILATVAILVDEPFGKLGGRVGPARGWLGPLTARLCGIYTRLFRPRRHRARLAVALDRIRLARGPREINAVVREELRTGVNAASLTIVEGSGLPRAPALVPILEHSTGLVDLSRGNEPFELLPVTDREWLEAVGVTLAAAVRLRDGTIAATVLLGQAGVAEPFTRSDHWFITTLLTGAAAAWDAADRAAVDDDCADECVGCGRVRARGDSPCCTGVDTRLAALPTRLADRFEVVRRLGSGGMGIVYLGHDGSLGRDVALKTWSGVGEAMAARLRSEAHVMATLTHDAIATIYGLEWWRRTPVLVMEFCAEGTLAARISHGPLPVSEVLRLGIRLADGLTYMHSRGVPHRDIKPSNIGFTASGMAKLLDFGLAGPDDQAGGTPGYLPPEARRGAPLGPEADLWGLATVLHEAVSDVASTREPLDAFFRTALAPLPADRFQSSQEMRAALCRLLVSIDA